MASQALRTEQPLSTPDRTASPDRTTRLLLTAGAVAGPVFVLVALLQVLTREGFDLARHPISLLAVGDDGWIQIANFISAGLLSLAFAVGVARTLRVGPGRRWAPALIGLYGLGLVIGGAFVADPGLGFPPGTPEGIPDSLSVHGLVHAIAPPFSFLALIVACLVVARRLVWEGRRRGAAVTVVTAVACATLSIPAGPAVSVRLALAITLAFAWLTVYSVHLLRGPFRAAR
jgi:hypothetical protein